MLGQRGSICVVRLILDPDPADAYSRVPLPVAHWADRVFDWIELDPVDPQARRRRFSTGHWAVTARIVDEDWLILWQETEDDLAVVVYLGEDLR